MSNWPAPRALLQHEWPAFRAAVNRIFRPAGGDLTHELPLLFDEANRECLRVVVGADGTILAHAGCARREARVLKRKTTIAFIAAVFVDPAVRGQRLGTRVLVDALGRARPGADLVLASGDRDLYRRQGFEPAAPLARFCLPSATSLSGAARAYETREIGGGGSTTAIAAATAVSARLGRRVLTRRIPCATRGATAARRRAPARASAPRRRPRGPCRSSRTPRCRRARRASPSLWPARRRWLRR